MPVPEDLPEALVSMSMSMMEIGWLMPLVAITEIVGGALFIIKKFRALGAIVLFPVMIGILIIHFTVAPSGLPIALALAILLTWSMIENREKFLELIN